MVQWFGGVPFQRRYQPDPFHLLRLGLCRGVEEKRHLSPSQPTRRVGGGMTEENPRKLAVGKGERNPPTQTHGHHHMLQTQGDGWMDGPGRWIETMDGLTSVTNIEQRCENSVDGVE